MTTYLSRRLLWALLTLFLVVSLSFGLAYLLPADPARMVAGPHASPEVIARIRSELRLDQPVSAQYLHYLGQVARGDLGQSFRTHEPVTAALWRSLPYTALLAVGASVVQLVLGLPVGLYAALRKGRPTDLLAMAVALVGISAPTFLIGLLLMVTLGFRMDLFPLGGVGEGVGGLLRSATLPSLTLGIAGAAWYSRLMRGEFLEVASQDYMRTARAKGLSEWVVVGRHGLRNALVPVITFFGVDLGTLLGGAVVTETIFAWPGLGKLAIDSVLNQDIPVMLGTVLVASAAVVLSNLAVDVVHSLVDPRIRLS